VGAARYHTGTFFLGFFNGPTEGLKILLFSYLWTAFAGTPLPARAPSLSLSLFVEAAPALYPTAHPVLLQKEGG
jgi:hypothetical protein